MIEISGLQLTKGPMGKLIKFKPRTTPAGKEELSDNCTLPDLDEVMSELKDIVDGCQSLTEDPTEYSSMAVKITDMIQVIAEKYEVDPKVMISDLMYILASKDIINNLAEIKEDLDE